MAGKLSPSAQQKIAQLELFAPRVARIHTLVETLAVTKGSTDNVTSQLKRAADQLKLTFMTAGYDALSQICGTIVMTAARAGSPGAKVRILREHVGSLKFQLELMVRTVTREDLEAQARRQKQQEEKAAPEE